MAMICPYCEQDFIWRVRLSSVPHIRFALCPECDSVWQDNEVISDQGGTNFEQYMSDIRRPLDWKDVEKLALIE